MKKDFVIPIAVLLAICVVISGALAATNNVTSPIIVEAAAVRAERARTEILPSADGFTAIDARLPDGVDEAYAATNGTGYVFTLSATGYGGSGSLVLMAAVSPDGKIIAVKTLANGETKGLGSKVSEPAYETQFVGMDKNLTGYQAITGATISSKAYAGAVKIALEAYEVVKGAA
ncbi:MAG: FMN-binding protein [Oscillospiraceae bacterium]|jgi:electron transport complex protein RnfG|nr:FMN-binding protein [Oscillospiraceae bacterium]